MSSQANIPPEARTIQLFGIETGGENSPLWKNYQSFSPNTYMREFLNWKSTKRSFTREEVLEGGWLYIRNQGNSLLFRCHPDRSAKAGGLFTTNKTLQGSWVLYNADVGEVLRITLETRLVFEIVANRNSSIHSGIGYFRGQSTPVYFKFIHLR